MREEKYIIIRIDEDDYGCEERPDSYIPMVRVLLQSMEQNMSGEHNQKVIFMEDSLMYARNLNEGNEAVIGMDGKLYKPEMLYEPMDLENITRTNRQNECMDNYYDAVEEMDE